MNIRETILVSALILMPWARRTPEPTKAVPPDLASGKLTYMDYCAACHGADGRGHGPAASELKTPPANLRRLTIRHDGKFPEEYVSRVVRFGDPKLGHGSRDMPIWGPVFSMQENGDETGVRRRINNLCNYLASIQDKKS
ncbi:MAG: cytochrome c [Candidatus Acidiferrum sp.]